MQSPPGIPVYNDRIVGGEPQMGQVNGTTLAPHALKDYTPVSEEMLRHPDPSDWLQMRGNYEGYGFSKLTRSTRPMSASCSWCGRAAWSPASMRPRPSSTRA